ncbi:MAG: hypothetical protein ABII16_01990, partial [Patescibacteria group bacterium]
FKPLSTLLTVITLLATIKSSALAVCPVCTVAVGAGVGLSRYFGVDDLISGVWVGALIVSMSLWVVEALAKRKIRYKFLPMVVFLITFAFTVFPLQYTGIVGHPDNKLFGVDKLLLGIFLGAILFLGGVLLDKILCKINQNKIFFYYQKVIVPVTLLLIASVVIYLVTHG